MKILKALPLVAMSALAVLCLVGVGTASATTLEVTGIAKNTAVTIEATIQAGGSTTIADTSKSSIDTCTGSTIAGSTASPFTAATTITVPLSTLTFTGCTHTTDVIKPGTLHIQWTSNTHASVSSSGMEVTTISTIFGTSCIMKTGAGTQIGTLTGVTHGLAILDINGVVSKGICGDANWTGTYTVTSPLGLGVIK